ncbi:hypothetical protein JW935_25535 [candidate division KSB1 bacterium]|nr:hypothetical protein [candidate division KSB1 bacterium]
MPTYEELKDELIKISAILEKFPEQVKPQVYELLVDQFLGREAPPNPNQNPKRILQRKASPKKQVAEKVARAKKGRGGTGKESYSIDRDLNLRGDKSIPSFKDFYAEKKPSSAKPFNAVTVYYLKKMLGMDQVTLNHAYTCYAEVGKKPPTAFRQSFIDTKNKEGWIEFDEAGNLDIPHRGIVFVEHDLPKPDKQKKA